MNDDRCNDTNRDDETVTVSRQAVRFFAAACFTAGALTACIVITILASLAAA